MNKIRNFKEDLEMTENEDLDNLMNNFYLSKVKNISKVKKVNYDKYPNLQKLGVDRVVLLKNGKKLLIEEKFRFNVYNDIFIETHSSDNKLGWIKKESRTDILVYYIIPLNTIYVFDFRKLKIKFNKWNTEWLLRYGYTRSKNKNYTSKGICIPIDILENHLKTNMKKYTIRNEYNR